MDPSTLEPFEICHIRPPTENYSLTFRLTRNCGWNRCSFCPVYKGDTPFSRRTIEEIQQDIDRAGRIDKFLQESGALDVKSPEEAFAKVEALIREEEEKRGKETGKQDPLKAGDEGNAAHADWFSAWFKQEATLRDGIFHVLSWRLSGGETCFLGDANSLLLAGDFFRDILTRVKRTFPSIRRFTIYGRTASAARKPLEELTAYREAGLHRIHFGLESGSDRILQFMNKGETAEHHIEGCRKTREAGLSCSVYVMPGLGGAAWSDEHARETSRVINESAPDFIRLRSLEVFPGTPLEAAVKNGGFTEATEEQVAGEIRQLIEGITTNSALYSDSASNLLTVNGHLPQDKDKMLSFIDRYLSLSPRAKLEFSAMSRLNAFTGQYGGVSREIFKALEPCLRGQQLDFSIVSDNELRSLVRLIRSRLMP
ncbi:MAG TPA: radical SAM protein [Syntrophales bacterium]|jgi:radical SAM superfamily enzyme YgiQ (UPF0313 family)|nr:radical SAM protein [Syntrophales bacterium]